MLKRKVLVWVFSLEKDGDLRVLLLKTNERRGGFWQPVTGSVEAGESLAEAARREAEEETGIALGPSQVPFSLDHFFHFESRGEKIEEHGFAVQVDSSLPIQLDSNEHQAFEWTDARAAEKKIRFKSNIEMLGILTAKLNRAMI